MASRDLYPQEILQVVLDKSCAKAQSSIPTLAILSVLAGGVHRLRISCLFKSSQLAFRTNGAALRLYSVPPYSQSP